MKLGKEYIAHFVLFLKFFCEFKLFPYKKCLKVSLKQAYKSKNRGVEKIPKTNGQWTIQAGTGQLILEISVTSLENRLSTVVLSAQKWLRKGRDIGLRQGDDEGQGCQMTSRTHSTLSLISLLPQNTSPLKLQTQFRTQIY